MPPVREQIPLQRLAPVMHLPLHVFFVLESCSQCLEVGGEAPSECSFNVISSASEGHPSET